MNPTVPAFRAALRRIERSIGFQTKDGATCCGVTLAQCHALIEIGAGPGLSVKELSARLGLDKSTLSRTVETLVKDGLADRAPDPSDRRAVAVRLTKKGLASLAVIDKAWNAWGDALFRGIPKARHAQVLETLTLVADALETGFVSPTGCCKKGD
jgi:DNA-binding MarR family transcriptional regulator